MEMSSSKGGMVVRISENVKLFRTKSGFSQQELAKRIGVSQQMIFAIEKGFKVPSVAVLIAISDELHTTPNDILGYTKKEVDE